MADLTLSAQPRTVLGKKVAALRRAGITPANIYGQKVPSTAIQVDTRELDHLVRRAGHTALISLVIDGDREPRNVLVRDIERKAMTGQIVHVDFQQVSMLEKLKVSVPIILVGEAPVTESAEATVLQSLDTLEVECLPRDIPQHLEADLSALTDTTSAVHVRDLVLPAGVVALHDPDAVVAGVTLRVAEVEEEAAEAPEAEEVPTVAEQGETEPAEE